MRWLLKSFDKSSATRLGTELGVPAIVAQLLVQRGISNVENARLFLTPSLDQLHSPHRMLGMEKAVERLSSAISTCRRYG